MRYKIKDSEIRSENAAKPAIDAAAFLVNWLRKRESTPSALDYGCGKLRYTAHLAHRSKHIGLVDSQVQIERTQRICGEYTSVKVFASQRWPGCTIQNLIEFWSCPARRYDFVLCAHVLSAIPCPKARAKSLRAIRAALTRGGHALFVINIRTHISQKLGKDLPLNPIWMAGLSNQSTAYLTTVSSTRSL